MAAARIERPSAGHRPRADSFSPREDRHETCPGHFRHPGGSIPFPGTLGFDNDRCEAFFGNIDVLPLKNLAIGFQCKQGARFDDAKDGDFCNTHAGWLVNPNLALILACLNAEDRHSTLKFGPGGRVVHSLQYEF